MEQALYKLTYGLFVVSSKGENRDNALILNTVQQLTDNPKRLIFAINKANYSEKVIRETGKCNISVIDTSAPFSLFERFGFQSGRDVDKFASFPAPRSKNGLYYIDENCNAFFSVEIEDVKEYGTHSLFVGKITEDAVLSSQPSMSYEYYFANVKPKKTVEKTDSEKWVCKICGYEHEGELPDDFICPLCKHPASDFERV